MAVDFSIPKLGDNVSEGTIVDWLVEDGATVNEGDEILELETDKAVVPVPANASGVLKMGNFKAGDVVKIDEVVATIEPQDGGPTAEDTVPEPVADTAGETAAVREATAQTQQVAEPDSPAEQPGGNGSGQETPVVEPDHKATPLARKMAADMGLDLDTVDGSGSHGKVTKADVLRATGESQPAEKEAATRPTEPSS